MMELEIRNTIIPTNIIEHWQKVVDAISDLLSVPSAMINRVDPPDLEIFRSNIRDDKGYWNKIESYILDRSEAEFSHSICPECAEKFYPDLDIYD